MKKLLFILTILLVLMTVFSSPVSAQGMMNWFGNSSSTSSSVSTTAPFPSGYGFMPMMWWMMGGGGSPMMGGWDGFGLGWVFMIIFWVLIILGVVVLVRYLGGQHNANKDNTPLDILKERYARGEINKKEFENKKKDLSP